MESEGPLKEWSNDKITIALIIALTLSLGFVATAQQGDRGFFAFIILLSPLLLCGYGAWSRDILTSFFAGFGAGILTLLWHLFGSSPSSEFVPIYALLASIAWGGIGALAASISWALKYREIRWPLLVIWVGIPLFFFILVA